jgi:glycosyltransferase involved in cell wall biosynthesis
VKVAFVHNLRGGGARRTMAEHIRRLDGDVHEVCLATATTVTEAAAVVPLKLFAPGLPEPLRPPARYRDLAAILAAWRRAAGWISALEPDVVVAHPCQFLQCPPAITGLQVPTVYFCHEYRRVDYEPAAIASRKARTRQLYALLYALERRADVRAVASATRLLTNSRYTEAGIEQAYGRAATVVPLGVPDEFAPAAELPPATHLLTVGSLIPSKGHDLAIMAAARTAGRWPVVIVAPAPDQAEQRRLRASAAELGVELQIRIGVSDTELRDFYRSAIATLYLSVAEPYGLVSLEAQACGSPVVVSDQGGLPETVLDGRTGWIVPRDAAIVAGRLDRLDDARLRADMVAAAARHGGSFSWTESTRVLERQLRDAVSAGDGGHL